MTTETPGLIPLWNRLEHWLAENAREDYESLLPGASDDEIKRLEGDLGFPLHEDVRGIIRLHNGVTKRRSSTQPGAFLLGYSLLDVDSIINSHRDLVSMVEDSHAEGDEQLVVGRIADTRWVPIAQCVTGDLLFVDHRHHYAGEIGEISFGDPEYQMLWPRMDLMLEDLCNSVENQTPVTAVPRIPYVHEGRMLEWGVQRVQE
ncbi:SMI1/KNR4 family protein [Streptomyces sp. NBC_01549]|uniref:SMI1/KNR4 family protein n=1 Tax=unclassified Streptomyces TaxID=2593676 RepID=UPI00224FF927|nr:MULTISPECIES: SMI1/KNR4 family protein [unclassified Streptomyces]MCX4461818.1 SMI1/KNR4 family protein [Streptomyces sp. NBC_01719]MCX4598574.1 SMI1/KNR4 family protein [Streptomyces sp. NBC_01549]